MIFPSRDVRVDFRLFLQSHSSAHIEAADVHFSQFERGILFIFCFFFFFFFFFVKKIRFLSEHSYLVGRWDRSRAERRVPPDERVDFGALRSRHRRLGKHHRMCCVAFVASHEKSLELATDRLWNARLSFVFFFLHGFFNLVARGRDDHRRPRPRRREKERERKRERKSSKVSYFTFFCEKRKENF